MGALYIELSSFINKNKLYTWKSGTSADELKKKKYMYLCQKTARQWVSWEGKDWVDYFNMTILYLSNPSPRDHKD